MSADNDNKYSRLADIADDFLAAAGLPMPVRGTFGQLIEGEITEQESEEIDSITFDVTMSIDAREIDRKTVRLTEIFMGAALRAQTAEDAATLIPVDKTDRHTADQLEAAGAVNFANVVRIARVKKGFEG